MDDNRVNPIQADLEATLHDMAAEDLELLEPPDDVWEGIAAATGTHADSLADVVSLESRRRITPRLLRGVAVAVAVLVVGLASFALLRNSDDRIVARAALAHDPASFDPLGASARADAAVISEGGKLILNLDEANLPSPGEDADLEVWLIRPDEGGNVADLVSLGVVDPSDPVRLEVPATHDPDVYFVVDISVEPRDGDPSHSGRSILRGALDDA